MLHRFRLASASLDDFDVLFKLRLAAMRESLERIGRFDEQRAFERFRSTFDPAHTRLVLLDQTGTMAGCVAVKPVEGEAGDALLLEHFYLFPEHQGHGLGGEILRQLLAEADAEGRAVRLSVLQRSDAARFYQRYGFVETGQDEWDIYMERPPSGHHG